MPHKLCIICQTSHEKLRIIKVTSDYRKLIDDFYGVRSEIGEFIRKHKYDKVYQPKFLEERQITIQKDGDLDSINVPLSNESSPEAGHSFQELDQIEEVSKGRKRRTYTNLELSTKKKKQTQFFHALKEITSSSNPIEHQNLLKDISDTKKGLKILAPTIISKSPSDSIATAVLENAQTIFNNMPEKSHFKAPLVELIGYND